MQVICIIHWTNPGSNMQIAIMECWLVCHFACTIDSAELERDLVPISGMLPGFKVSYKVHRYFVLRLIYATQSWKEFHGFFFFAQRLSGSIAAHLAGTWLFFKCEESAGSLVVFIPPKANTPRLHERAQAHTVLRKYNLNWATEKK